MKVQTQGSWTLSERACSVLEQDCAEVRALKEVLISVRVTLPLAGKIEVLSKNFMITLLVMLGPNYKCNLCIGNPLEISIKFDICVFSIFSYQSWFLGQTLPSLFIHSKWRLSCWLLQSLILFFQSIAASQWKKKKDKGYSRSSSYFSVAFHLVRDLRSYLQVIMLVMFIGKINL